jgi:hypothetical protein
LDVPIVTHELSFVHATVESGTEMLKAGSPLTCGFATIAVAHDANTTPASAHIVTIRTSERPEAGTRIIVSLVRDDRCRLVDDTEATADFDSSTSKGGLTWCP